MARGFATADNGGGVNLVGDFNYLWGGYTQMAWVRVSTDVTTTAPNAVGMHTDAGADDGLIFDKNPPSTSRVAAIEIHGSLGGNAVDLTYSGLNVFIYHHYAWTVLTASSGAGGWIRAYMDGRFVGARPFDSAFGGGNITKIMAVGAHSNFAAAAFVQHQRVWARVLTLGEIQQEMKSRFAVSRHRIVCDLPLIYDERDLVGQGLWNDSGSAVSVTTEVGPILGGGPGLLELAELSATSVQVSPINLPGYYV
jgi:hypothetical protein